MRIHMVAIGGSVMHNLALDLAAAGHLVTGSDDEFYEPSRSRLADAGLLPVAPGWFSEKIDPSLDCVIAGMHAKNNNPEIRLALDLGIPVYSFPEFFGQRCRDKVRIVVAGSHGKTTTTAMIMHALKTAGMEFDYLVGASLTGFDRNVRLSDAPVVVIEGDEYPSSPLDLRPKIMHYDPDIVIITGVAWDHMNVFPTWEHYVQLFRDFVSALRPGAKLIWFEQDETLAEVVRKNAQHVRQVPYRAIGAGDQTDDNGGLQDRQESTIFNARQGRPDPQTERVADNSLPGPALGNGIRVSGQDGRIYRLRIFGTHNLQNMAAAALACAELGITESQFFTAMESFTGAAMRLQLLVEHENLLVYRDFAHAPSKVTATVLAVRERYPGHFLIACLELHSYSSLNATFLPEYKGSLNASDHAILFYSPKTLEIKKMPLISPGDITRAFAHHSMEVVTSRNTLEERLHFFGQANEKTIILLMSSGRFENAELTSLFQTSQQE